jgi:hypothetical protein
MTDIWFLKPFEWTWNVIRKLVSKWTLGIILTFGFLAMVFDEPRTLIIKSIKWTYAGLSTVDFLGIWTGLYNSLKKWWYPKVVLPAITLAKSNPTAIYVIALVAGIMLLLQGILLAIMKFSPASIRAIQRWALRYGLKVGVGGLIVSAFIIFQIPFIDPYISTAIKSVLLIVGASAYGTLKEAVLGFFKKWAHSGTFTIEEISKELSKKAQEVTQEEG